MTRSLDQVWLFDRHWSGRSEQSCCRLGIWREKRPLIFYVCTSSDWAGGWTAYLFLVHTHTHTRTHTVCGGRWCSLGHSCVCVCVCVYIYICVCVRVFKRVCLTLRICVCACVWARAPVYLALFSVCGRTNNLTWLYNKLPRELFGLDFRHKRKISPITPFLWLRRESTVNDLRLLNAIMYLKRSLNKN